MVAATTAQCDCRGVISKTIQDEMTSSILSTFQTIADAKVCVEALQATYARLLQEVQASGKGHGASLPGAAGSLCTTACGASARGAPHRDTAEAGALCRRTETPPSGEQGGGGRDRPALQSAVEDYGVVIDLGDPDDPESHERLSFCQVLGEMWQEDFFPNIFSSMLDKESWRTFKQVSPQLKMISHEVGTRQMAFHMKLHELEQLAEEDTAAVDTVNQDLSSTSVASSSAAGGPEGPEGESEGDGEVPRGAARATRGSTAAAAQAAPSRGSGEGSDGASSSRVLARPAGGLPALPPLPPLPPGWEEYWCEKKQQYQYWGPEGETTWERPQPDAESPNATRDQQWNSQIVASSASTASSSPQKAQLQPKDALVVPAEEDADDRSPQRPPALALTDETPATRSHQPQVQLAEVAARVVPMGPGRPPAVAQIRFSYSDGEGEVHGIAPVLGDQRWTSFQLEEGEFLAQVTGRFGDYLDSIRFVTNKNRSLQFGNKHGGDYAFNEKAPSGFQIWRVQFNSAAGQFSCVTSVPCGYCLREVPAGSSMSSRPCKEFSAVVPRGELCLRGRDVLPKSVHARAIQLQSATPRAAARSKMRREPLKPVEKEPARPKFTITNAAGFD